MVTPYSRTHRMIRTSPAPNTPFFRTISITPMRIPMATIADVNDFSKNPLLADGGHRLGRLDGLLDAAHHVERLLGQVVVLALENLLEGADGVLERHELALAARELLADEERLRQHPLDAPRAGDDALVVFGQLFHAQDRDDVLQVLIALEDALAVAGDLVMLLAD